MQRVLTIGPLEPPLCIDTSTVNCQLPGSTPAKAVPAPRMPARRSFPFILSILFQHARKALQHDVAPEELEHRVDRRRLRAPRDDTPKRHGELRHFEAARLRHVLDRLA